VVNVVEATYSRFDGEDTPNVAKDADLTPRERRVCALIARGHSDKEIAYMLGLSTASVTASLQRAPRKLDVPTRLTLVRA
jgi:DNA-binding CsgD family transcriptional regulator